MSPGKHHTKKISNAISKKILIFILCILIIFLIAFPIFYIIDTLKTNSTNVDTSTNSTIKITKKIIGLENIEITEMDIKCFFNYSMVKISFKNISNNKVDSCEINLYLLDENESIIFGSSLELPDIESNSSETFNILCSSNISNVSDYKVVLNK